MVMGRLERKYNNLENGFNEWFLKHLKGFLTRGFNEYNSNAYSGYSFGALTNLYDYAYDAQVKKAAQIVLDLASARFATQSFDLKRCVGFCRKAKLDYSEDPDLWADPMAVWFAVLIGNYAGLQENYAGIWSWRKHHMIQAASTSYRVPDLILDLAIDKSHNPYEMRVNHSPSSDFKHPHAKNIEILSARRGYLLTAGGRFSDNDFWWYSFLEPEGNINEILMRNEGVGTKEHSGWAHPITLITRDGQRIFEPRTCMHDPCESNDYLIYSVGNADREHRNNTCVFQNFAASASSFHIPCRYRPPITGEYGWQFLHLADSGLYVAINNNWNVLEVVDDQYNGGPTLHDFRNNCERQRGVSGQEGTYTNSDNHSITFNAGESPGTWPIVGAGERNYHKWPFIDCIPGNYQGRLLSRVMWADGLGKVIINNPYMHRSLILSLFNPLNPIRIEQGCPAIRLTTRRASPAIQFEAKTNSNNAFRAFDGDSGTSWGVSLQKWSLEQSDREQWLQVDFGEPKTFKFISIRGSKGRSYFAGERIETSLDGTSYTAYTVDYATDVSNDIEMPIPITARYVRFYFILSPYRIGFEYKITLDIEEIEIYQFEYLPRTEIEPDTFEVNNRWNEAACIEPGQYQNLTIHHIGDEDFYQIEIMPGYRIRVNLIYGTDDFNINRGRLSLDLLGWPDQIDNYEPVLLETNQISQTFGSEFSSQVIEYSGQLSSETCFIRVIPQGPGVGEYWLTVTTYGPGLEEDQFETEENTISWHHRERLIQGEILLTPEPVPESDTDPCTSQSMMTVLENRNIHTPDDRDRFVVTVPWPYDLRIPVTPNNPDLGKPYAWIDPSNEDNAIDRMDDDRSDWPNCHTLTIKPHFHGISPVQIHFQVKASRPHRYETGGYILTLEFPSYNTCMASIPFNPFGLIP